MSQAEQLDQLHYRSLADASGIDPNVIRDRGYRTVRTKAELRKLGFGESQQIVPTLLIPIHGVHGDVVGHQHRPDSPRRTGDRVMKYETPYKSTLHIDVPPRCRPQLANPSVPLLVTEGSKKADAAAGRDLCCVALPGVWGFRGTNALGGKLALADWESIALNGRVVYIVFDSDVMLNTHVRKALVRFRDFLVGRKASVRLVFLQCGDGGTKVGLDDYFVAGGDCDGLMRLATTDLPPDPLGRTDEPYLERDGCLYWNKSKDAHEEHNLLCNFTTRIARDVLEDDGVETRRFYDLEAKCCGKSFVLTVSAEAFASLNWVQSGMGSMATIEPQQPARERIPHAILTLSTPDHVTAFRHSGWRKIDGKWCYLHAGGALGASGPVSGVSMRIASQLKNARLPEPPCGSELKADVDRFLRLATRLAPGDILWPGIGAVFRAVLGEADLSVFLVGKTGLFKSEFTAFLQSFFGAFSAKTLPISWSSSANAIEELAFLAKDMFLCVDDFIARTPKEREKLMEKAERVFRGTGNRQGRQRMRADTTLRPERPPRCLIVATGEETPEGHSLLARCYVAQIAEGMIGSDALTEVQKAMADGLFSRVMAAFIQHLASRFESVRGGMHAAIAELRKRMVSEHRRTSTVAADLALGVRLLLQWLVEIECISQGAASKLWRQAFSSIARGASAQSAVQAEAEPTVIFRKLLQSCLGTGAAFLADSLSGREPRDWKRFGWEYVEVGTAIERETGKGYFRARGQQIGWVDETDSDPKVYLDLEAALSALQRRGREIGLHIPTSPGTLKRALFEQGLLASTETEKAKGGIKLRYEVQRTVDGKRMRVLHFRASAILQGQPSQEPEQTASFDEAPTPETVTPQEAQAEDASESDVPGLWGAEGPARDAELEREGVEVEGAGRAASGEGGESGYPVGQQKPIDDRILEPEYPPNPPDPLEETAPVTPPCPVQRGLPGLATDGELTPGSEGSRSWEGSL